MIEKGVLHLDQNEFVGENEKMRRKDRKRERKKGRKGDPAPTGLQCSNNKNFDGSRSDLVYAPRGRGSLLLWLFSV